jgi:hypothetical protein
MNECANNLRLIASKSIFICELIDEPVENAEKSATLIRMMILDKAKRDKMLSEIYTQCDDTFMAAIRYIIDSESKDGKVSFCISAHYQENPAGKVLITEIRTPMIPEKTVLVERI